MSHEAALTSSAAQAIAPDLFPSRIPPTISQIEAGITACLEVQRRAVTQGKRPFAAVLLGPDSETVLLTHQSIDQVNHAESSLARLAYSHYTKEYLWRCTLVTTNEQLAGLTGPGNRENFTLKWHTRDILEGQQKDIEIIGPVEGMDKLVVEESDKYWNPKVKVSLWSMGVVLLISTCRYTHVTVAIVSEVLIASGEYPVFKKSKEIVSLVSWPPSKKISVKFGPEPWNPISGIAACFHESCYWTYNSPNSPRSELSGRCERQLRGTRAEVLYRMGISLRISPTWEPVWECIGELYPRLDTDTLLFIAPGISQNYQPSFLSKLPPVLRCRIWSLVKPGVAYYASMMVLKETGRLSWRAYESMNNHIKELVVEPSCYIEATIETIYGTEYIRNLSIH
ncbi:hypothetical protein NHQ30_009724 [Ciborinia camelliae]|nr:hypothetical protein NHQ30_009724 [Ciborinia camelliae]